MMQVFNPGNLAAVFGMGGEFVVAKGAKAILPALGTGLAKSAKEGTKAVNNVAQQAKSWLGKDYKVVTNKAGDNIFMSKDRLRKMRFDIKNPHGDSPHIHLEEFINGKWRDAIPGTHRIYPQP